VSGWSRSMAQAGAGRGVNWAIGLSAFALFFM
jgi:hypothetical protein